jgi:putative membrane protein
MFYLFLKAFHLAAVLTWVGGMLALSVALAARPAHMAAGGSADQTLLAALHRWDRRITTPALAVVWLLGIALVVMGGWYSAPWMWAKFAIVCALSGLHGKQSASLRRLLGGQAEQAAARWVPAFTIAAISAVALLVILKPWGAA